MGRMGHSSRQAAPSPTPCPLSPPLHSAFFRSPSGLLRRCPPCWASLNGSPLFHPSPPTHPPHLPPPPLPHPTSSTPPNPTPPTSHPLNPASRALQCFTSVSELQSKRKKERGEVWGAHSGGGAGGRATGRAQSRSLRHCGCLVVQAQRFTRAVVARIPGKTIRRISEGFVIKGDSPKPETARHQGSAPRSWAAMTVEGRPGKEAAPPPAGDTQASALSSYSERTWKNSLVQGRGDGNRDDRQQASPFLPRWACSWSPHGLRPRAACPEGQLVDALAAISSRPCHLSVDTSLARVVAARAPVTER